MTESEALAAIPSDLRKRAGEQVSGMIRGWLESHEKITGVKVELTTYITLEELGQNIADAFLVGIAKGKLNHGSAK